MARLARKALPPYGIFHITARGVDGCLMYRDAVDYELFSGLFKRGVRNARLEVWAYCWMPNHYHALIEGPLEAISRAFHWINGIHAQEFNERHDRRGHLLQDRFHSKVIRDDEHLAHACDYIWNNPVRAGLCAKAGDWPWSGQILRSR